MEIVQKDCLCELGRLVSTFSILGKNVRILVPLEFSRRGIISQDVILSQEKIEI
jgi:hypothetical protein